jgi:outer membrane lipoprotein LolB
VKLIRFAAVSASVFAIIFIAGCACPERLTGQNDGDSGGLQRSDIYRGRLALKIGDDAPANSSQPQPQSFSAAFELTGNAQNGSLEFYSPLGSTLAALRWTPQIAQLQRNGETRLFDSLENLLLNATGASIPVASLFAWLAGNNAAVDGWDADLSQFTNQRIVARRASPKPGLELRLILEK